MAYERYPRGTQPGDYYNRGDDMDYGRDYGSGRDYTASSARDYAAAGELGGDRGGYGRDQGGNRDAYGSRDYGYQRYGQRDQQQSRGRGYYGGRGAYGADQQRGYARADHGSYAHDGRRFEDVGQYRHADDDNYRSTGRASAQQRSGYGRQPQGYDYEDRGFFARAGDEVRSWFGDDEAERRREYDQRYDERYDRDNGGNRDSDYHSWRAGQISALDRDYDEYRRENRTKFENEFSSWRTERQGQRDSLSKVAEHMDVVGSDGAHVGTVDKVRGDRILLTKNDSDANGRHHSIPSRWIETVDSKVTLRKTADEAKSHWRDEERNQAFFGDKPAADDTGADDQGRTLNKSFSGTY